MQARILERDFIVACTRCTCNFLTQEHFFRSDEIVPHTRDPTIFFCLMRRAVMQSICSKFNCPVPKPVTHVIFDLDGLLIDSEDYYTIATRDVIKRFGGDFQWQHKVKVLGSVDIRVYETLIQEFNLPLQTSELQKLIVEECRQYMPKVNYMPGVKKLLEHLKKSQIPMAIASSSSRGAFEVKTKFDEDFLGYFHHCTLSREDTRVKESKPAPDVFNVCRESFGSPTPQASDCLVFEDSPPGVIAGCRAGMQVIMVPNPQLDVESFMEKQPDFRPTQIISSLESFDPLPFNLPKSS